MLARSQPLAHINVEQDSSRRPGASVVTSYLKNHIAAIVNFGGGGNGAEFEVYGWRLPEQGFTWTSGSESCLLFPKYDAPFGMFVELDASPQMPPGSPERQRLSVSANGTQLGAATICKRLLATFYVPPLDHTASALILTIGHTWCDAQITDAASPALSCIRLRMIVLDNPMPARSTRCSHVAVAEPATGTSLTSMALPELTSRFESLGTSCEVGFVQRRSGAEPLGLLRFAAIPLPRLLDAIDAEFAGLDQPNNLKPEGTRGWDIRDGIYQIFYHTGRRCEDVSADSLRHGEARRLRFLIRKFMASLAHPEKIFVWWQYNRVNEAEILPLFLALRRRGPVTMLWVEKDEPAGLVEEIWPGLLRARIAAFSQDKGEPDPQKSFRNWIEIMTNAWLLARPDTPSGSGAAV
jgi:hypothetical protein